ncbi:hypothetical protein [Chryseobacterium sediminis]|uniref:Rha family transcriptional regulator n=1 Tax=Chryseobacterium sediminis TaxID=1679494 RepID=A0A5B2U8U9_9FLAO|nr:hypothetical protein [Chryseobacterium sediminis]KAA2222982.1 hypothetical protein FW780_01920 [Chryseobacterium sediminis]
MGNLTNFADNSNRNETINNALSVFNDVLSIRAYFERIRELKNSGEKYPVDLDDVWALCYPKKQNATNSLTSNYIEDLDYSVFTKNGKNSKGGRPKIAYMLSVSCFEHFIARKHKEVFDVYSKMFHKTMDEADGKKIMSQIDILVQSALALQEHDRRISTVEEKVNMILEDQERNIKQLNEIPFELHKEETELELPVRDKIRLLVNKISAATSISQHEIWNNVYQTLYYNYRISIKSYKKEKKNESYLDIAERKGFLECIFAIVSKLVADKQVA